MVSWVVCKRTFIYIKHHRAERQSPHFPFPTGLHVTSPTHQ